MDVIVLPLADFSRPTLEDKCKCNAPIPVSFEKQGIGALSHNNKDPERVLLRDFEY
jgi:hypothetical protein